MSLFHYLIQCWLNMKCNIFQIIIRVMTRLLIIVYHNKYRCLVTTIQHTCGYISYCYMVCVIMIKVKSFLLHTIHIKEICYIKFVCNYMFTFLGMAMYDRIKSLCLFRALFTIDIFYYHESYVRYIAGQTTNVCVCCDKQSIQDKTVVEINKKINVYANSLAFHF